MTVFLACLAILPSRPALPTPSVVQPPPPLFHGNWCGLGDLGRGRPVDALDAACRAHDLCYERVGRGACACDRAFLRATAALAQRRQVDDGTHAKAALANTLFALTPCVETGKSRRRFRKH
ncbi:phospholipase A2 family protein [Microvirga pakistanensis]|uniref:phospholipase A2 family protein n=1 Tax=Microvirga pakistanensis TaxID=1682650 RepID=UPI001FCEC371|nr:phospholipase A2 family protein [Microvirga pakistanensis]